MMRPIYSNNLETLISKIILLFENSITADPLFFQSDLEIF
jgi:hypothetical protein